MKKRHRTPEQIIRLLAEGEMLLGQGQPVDEMARHLEISGRPGTAGRTGTTG